MRIGTSELVVIFIVALLVLGPDKVPKYAKKAGKFLSSIKVYADKLSEDINESIVEPLKEVQKTPVFNNQICAITDFKRLGLKQIQLFFSILEKQYTDVES